jgi:hypothetical protein
MAATTVRSTRAMTATTVVASAARADVWDRIIGSATATDVG